MSAQIDCFTLHDVAAESRQQQEQKDWPFFDALTQPGREIRSQEHATEHEQRPAAKREIDWRRVRKKSLSSWGVSFFAIRLPKGAALVVIHASIIAPNCVTTDNDRPMRPASTRTPKCEQYQVKS